MFLGFEVGGQDNKTPSLSRSRDKDPHYLAKAELDLEGEFRQHYYFVLLFGPHGCDVRDIVALPYELRVGQHLDVCGVDFIEADYVRVERGEKFLYLVLKASFRARQRVKEGDRGAEENVVCDYCVLLVWSGLEGVVAVELCPPLVPVVELVAALEVHLGCLYL